MHSLFPCVPSTSLCSPFLSTGHTTGYQGQPRAEDGKEHEDAQGRAKGGGIETAVWHLFWGPPAHGKMQPSGASAAHSPPARDVSTAQGDSPLSAAIRVPAPHCCMQLLVCLRYRGFSNRSTSPRHAEGRSREATGSQGQGRMVSAALRRKQKISNEDEHLATLEPIFLFLCPQMIQCLFLCCCTTLTQGIKLCCLHCQLGMELSFCN